MTKNTDRVKHNRAFTLIEVVIVIAIISFIAGFSAVANFQMYGGFNLKNEQNLIVSLLRRARGQAINNVNALPHGLHLEAGRYMLFQGTDWSSRAAGSDVIFPANAALKVSGPGDFIFLQLSGSATSAGNINIWDGRGKTLTVNVNAEGQINGP